MKKLTLFLLLLSSLYSDEQFYVGSNVGVVNETFTNTPDTKSSSYMTNVKFGYGIISSYAVELSFDYIKNRSKIFSSTTQNDGNKVALNIELLKAFDFNPYILPFIKAGFGSGFFKTQRETQDMLHYGSLNITIGAFIPINKHFDFEVGYGYKRISYEAVDTITDAIRFKSNAQKAYVGFNIRY